MLVAMLVTAAQGPASNGTSGNQENDGTVHSSSSGTANGNNTMESVFSITDRGNSWGESSWFGFFWTGSGNAWIYHSLLGWLYVHLNDDGSVWMFSEDLSSIPLWMWTGPKVFPYVYSIPTDIYGKISENAEGFWLHLNLQSGVIQKWFNQAWSLFRDFNKEDLYVRFDNLLKPFMEKKQWSIPRYLSNSSELLTVAMHYAYTSKDEKLMKYFKDQMDSVTLTEQQHLKSLNIYNFGLSRLTILHVFTQYLKLSTKYNGESATYPEGFIDFLNDELNLFWKIPNPGWPPYNPNNPDQTVSERVRWGLSHYESQVFDHEKYFYAINDDLWRFFGASGELKQYYNLTGKAPPSFIEEILDTAYDCFRRGGEFTDTGGWIFQPGMWEKSADHKYAGHKAIVNPLTPKIVSNIAWDTSHFSMMPGTLTSLQMSYGKESPEYHFYKRIKSGLAHQFYSVVVKGNKTTNYMDGSNGIYRFRPHWNDAYLPFELSGTLLFGRWVFLDSGKEEAFFNNLSQPLSSDQMSIYLGPFSRRTNSPDQIEEYYKNPDIILISRLASMLARLRANSGD